MRNFVKIGAALAASLLILASCGGENDAKTTSGVGTTAAPSASQSDDGMFSDLHKTVDAVRGYYGDTVKFVFSEDEYSDEVLEYTYGIYDERFTSAVDSFVLSECDGMRADTFAVVRFKSGTDASVIKDAAKVMEDTYIAALKSKLSAYNPDEFAASDKYILKTYDNALMMVISSEHGSEIAAAAEK